MTQSASEQTKLADIVERLREEAHLFELHNPCGGITVRSRVDVEMLRRAADEITRLRAERPGWRTMEGCDREKIPGVHLALIVGGTEHSGVRWRRSGIALLSQNNTGPFGYDADSLVYAQHRLDMQWIDAIPLWRPLPDPPPFSIPP